MAMIAWGEYKPDVSDLMGNATRVIANVIPRGDGYGPISDLTAYTDALPAACRGAFRALNSDGSIAIFAGTSTKLYRLSNTDLSWTDVSPTASSNMDLSALDSIGDMTDGGDLAAAFDDDDSQAAADCAQVTATSGYIGKTFTTPTAVRSAVIYGSSDAGFVSGDNPSVTIKLWGKKGAAPSDPLTDGVEIATLTFSDTADESAGRSLTSTSNALWDHVWATVVVASSATLNVAELTIKGADTYSLPSSEQWQFGQYSSFVVAVQPGANPQKLQLGTDTIFADLGGSPPVARYVGVVSEFIVLTGLVSNPSRAQWCGRSDPSNWTAGTGESDFQDFVDGGPCNGPIAGGEQSAILMQNYSMRRMTYQPGSPVIFSFERISQDIGLLAPLSMIETGERIFFISNAGFQMSVNGSVPQPIGKERIDNTFIQEWDDNSLHLTFGFADPRGTRVYWAYKTDGAADGLFNKMVCYDWVLNRWSPVEDISGEFISALAQVGQTLEGLDDTGFDLDDLPVSLDAFPVAFGKEIAALNSSHELGFLRGPALEATLETPEQGTAARQTYIDGMRPITDAESVFGSVSARQNLKDARIYIDEQPMDAAGFLPSRTETRWHRARNRIPAGTSWSFSAGVELQSKLTGNR